MSKGGRKHQDNAHRDVDFSQLDSSEDVAAESADAAPSAEAGAAETQPVESKPAAQAKSETAEAASSGETESSAALPPQDLANDVEFLTKELERVEEELAEMKDKYLRALAESDNIRKRATKERSDLLKYQGERILVDMLDVVDNFERAIATPGNDIEKYKQGVELIYRRLMDILGKWEVRGESGVGQTFDPVKHEAISKVPADDAVPGTILSELRRAFFYKDKLIRPGEVVVVSERSAAHGDGGADDGIDRGEDEDNPEDTVS